VIAPDPLRALPSVQELLLLAAPSLPQFPHALVVREIRSLIEDARSSVIAGKTAPGIDALARLTVDRVRQFEAPSLRHVINATGVVIHTNLGRAPLGDWQPIAGYSNLEYDLKTGRRGKRDAHLHNLFEALLNRPAIAVNNGAAATFLALHELAAGYEVVVSRGELIEIGDGFRIPDILTRSGAILREVGTTNRTRLEDYREAINQNTRLILRVHPSNFHITGFTAKPTLVELASLGRELGIPVYEDLGSGNVVDLRPFGVHEPLVSESLQAGVNLVSFSGDKLLGGPQAGILAGDAILIQRLRRNPLFRALRLDKLIYQSLENTLRNVVLERWDQVPALAMIRQTAAEIGARASRLFPNKDLIPGESVIGGGSTPDQCIPTTLIVAATANVNQAERQLRRAPSPVIARIAGDKLLLDLRTVFVQEEPALVETVNGHGPPAHPR
jgi:L-seryl-tRNA(Ser) seleniumtransferase